MKHCLKTGILLSKLLKIVEPIYEFLNEVNRWMNYPTHKTSVEFVVILNVTNKQSYKLWTNREKYEKRQRDKVGQLNKSFKAVAIRPAANE